MYKENETVYRPKLTEKELADIQKLQQKGAEKGIRYKLDPGTDSGIVCRRNDIVAGFMTVDCFDGQEVESAAIADNLADWEEMATVLMDCAKEKKAERILFLCDPNDTIIRQKLESMGLARAFSEYRMVFDASAFSPGPVQDVSLCQATQEDCAYLFKLDVQAFDDVPDDVPQHDLERTRLIRYNGKAAGKLRTGGTDEKTGIYGVVVEKELRGKGIGRKALTLLLRELIEAGKETIYLEVDSQNPAAFHLYQKLGFAVQSEFGYYAYDCEDRTYVSEI